MDKLNLPKATKFAMFTDIHWGARGNSLQHNLDNLDYLDWFISNLPNDVSHIAFLGDWFENRSAINVQTLAMASEGIKKLDALGIPIIFITGNHDLYKRHTREVHSLGVFDALKHVNLVEKPMSLHGEQAFLPYLFDEEYKALVPELNTHKELFGHFEFNGFVLTGHSHVMEHGQDPALLKGQRKIFSGHFHKRQATGNICYIGNTFPTNYGDCDDDARGFATYDVTTGGVEFIDWAECPKFTRTKLSVLNDGRWQAKPKTRVKCTVDIDMAYTEVHNLKEQLVKQYDLRELIMEEDGEAKDALLKNDNTDAKDLQFTSIDDLIVTQLTAANDDPSVKGKYDIPMLVKMYKNLKVEHTSKD